MQPVSAENRPSSRLNAMNDQRSNVDTCSFEMIKSPNEFSSVALHAMEVVDELKKQVAAGTSYMKPRSLSNAEYETSVSALSARPGLLQLTGTVLTSLPKFAASLCTGEHLWQILEVKILERNKFYKDVSSKIDMLVKQKDDAMTNASLCNLFLYVQQNDGFGLLDLSNASHLSLRMKFYISCDHLILL